MVADIDGNKIMDVVRKTCTERRKISLLIDLKVRKRLQELIELVDVGASNLWGRFKDGVFRGM